MDDKERTLKALEDMKESMAYAVRRRATADVVSLEAQVLALAEALRYWIPDECNVCDQEWNAWNKHMALLAKLTTGVQDK